MNTLLFDAAVNKGIDQISPDEIIAIQKKWLKKRIHSPGIFF